MEDAAVIDVVINPRARPVIEKAGHGSSWLAELEELLSHDEWEPVDGREALRNEVRALLAGRPQLRTYTSRFRPSTKRAFLAHCMSSTLATATRRMATERSTALAAG